MYFRKTVYLSNNYNVVLLSPLGEISVSNLVFLRNPYVSLAFGFTAITFLLILCVATISCTCYFAHTYKRKSEKRKYVVLKLHATFYCLHLYTSHISCVLCRYQRRHLNTSDDNVYTAGIISYMADIYY